MNSYRGLIIRYLKSQKKRTVLTVIGIILSVSLLSAAGVFGESLKATMLERIKENFGAFHVSYSDLDQNQLQVLQNHAKAAEVGYDVRAGVDQIAKGQSLFITGADQNFCRLMYLSLHSGHWPQHDREIVLEQWVLDSLKINPNIGDKITLSINTGANPEGIKGADLNQGTEGTQGAVKREFILTGIIKNKPFMSSGVSMGIVTPATAKELLQTSDLKYTARVVIKEGLPIQPTISQIQQNLKLKNDQVAQNNNLLTALNQSNSNSINAAVLVVEGIAVFVILLTSMAVIYNAFHISVLERIHQFGVLRSNGTTPKQIRGIVLGEALLLSIVSIPIGLLCGTLAVKAVISIFAGFKNFPDFQVVTPGWILAGTALLGLLSVLASAYGPARTAGKVSPLEAILNNARQKISKVKPRRHSMMGYLFGIEGLMAYENIRRSKKRFYVTVSSISIGVMLFIFFSYFMTVIDATTQKGYFHQDFDVERSFDADQTGYSQQDYTEVSQISGVTKVYRVMQKNMLALVTDGQASSDYSKFVRQSASDRIRTYNGKQYVDISAYFWGYRDLELQMFKDNLLEGSIDLNSLHGNGVLVTQSVQERESAKMNATKLKVGDEIQVAAPAANNQIQPVKLRVVGILDKMPMNYTGGPDKYGIVTSEETFQTITGNNSFARFDIAVTKTADRTAVLQKLQSIANRVPDSRALDFNGSDTAVIFIETILYGLLTVLSVIGAINIINTISTNLILRLREFGTLQAVGMTMRQMKKMIRLEAMLYGLVGTFYGALAGGALAWLIYQYYNKIMSLIWHFPWQPMVEGAAVAIIIGILASAAPVKRISRMNVVDAIRLEE